MEIDTLHRKLPQRGNQVLTKTYRSEGCALGIQTARTGQGTIVGGVLPSRAAEVVIVCVDCRWYECQVYKEEEEG